MRDGGNGPLVPARGAVVFVGGAPHQDAALGAAWLLAGAQNVDVLVHRSRVDPGDIRRPGALVPIQSMSAAVQSVLRVALGGIDVTRGRRRVEHAQQREPRARVETAKFDVATISVGG